MIKIKITLAGIIVATVTLLSSCNTIKGASSDLYNLGQGIKNTVQRH